MMGQYRKRSVVIEARQTGQDYDEDCSIMEWCSGRFPLAGADYGESLFIIIFGGAFSLVILWTIFWVGVAAVEDIVDWSKKRRRRRA